MSIAANKLINMIQLVGVEIKRERERENVRKGRERLNWEREREERKKKKVNNIAKPGNEIIHI